MKLSEKENKVLELIAMGYSDKEIGMQMEIAYCTVRNYVDRLVMKLNARNRTNAAIRYLKKNPGWLQGH